MNTVRKMNTQDVYEALRDMIIALRLAPGSRVTENQLADYFSVSRTPIRAALQRLESEGYLSIKSKQGCFIRNIDMLKISQYYDVRVSLEVLVLEEIAKQQSQEALNSLANKWNPESPEYGLVVNDELKIAEENFHLQLAIISKNDVLINYIGDINDQIRVVRRLGWPNKKSVTDTYEEHYRICELLLANDISQAQSEMTNHIRKSQDMANRITLNQLYGGNEFIRFD